MKLTAPSAIGTALLLLGAGCGGTSSSSAAEDVNSDDVYVMLAEQNESGESGTARLIPLGKRTKVVLELTGPAATRQQAHIHTGSCDQLDPRAAYALSEVKSGNVDDHRRCEADDAPPRIVRDRRPRLGLR